MIIDSGATLSVWNTRRSATTESGDDVGVRALTGSITLRRIALEGLALGALRMPALTVLAADLRPVELASGQRIDLVIGQDVLSLFTLHIALTASPTYVEFITHESRSGSSPDGLDLARGEAGTLLIDSALSGKPAKGMIDLGSDAALYVSRRWMNEQGVRPLRTPSMSMSAGVEGRQVHAICTLQSLRVGALLLQDLPTIILDDWRHDYDAVIGLPVWRRFDQWLDVQNLRLRLGSADLTSPFERNRSGISAERLKDRLSVVFVAPGSPAAHAGLRAGDQVVEIDGQPLNADFFSRRPRPGAEASGTVERLTLATGESKVIILQDYY